MKYECRQREHTMERDKNPILTKLALYNCGSSIRKTYNKCEEAINMELRGGNSK